MDQSQELGPLAQYICNDDPGKTYRTQLSQVQNNNNFIQKDKTIQSMRLSYVC